MPMKVFLLSTALFFACAVHAQNQVQTLPPGKYETVLKTTESKWEKVILFFLMTININYQPPMKKATSGLVMQHKEYFLHQAP